MNISLPDDANIQILVLPSGAPPLLPGTTLPPAAPLLEEAPLKATKSRRRDVLFLGSGAMMAAAILFVVQAQNPHAPRAIEPAHTNLLAPQPPNPALGRLTQADIGAPSPDVDPSEAVRRLLAARPTVTPPPGAPGAQAAPTSSPPASAPGGKRNAFGMVD